MMVRFGILIVFCQMLLVLSGSVCANAQCGVEQTYKLLSDSESDFFGHSVSISGAVAIVGAHNDDSNGQSFGSAYLFNTTTGKQIAKLLANDGASGDIFGWSVSISGNTAIVGAHFNDDNGFNSGSAYLFDVNTGQQIAKLLPADGAAGDNFGWSVSISGNTAIVGTYLDEDNGEFSGSAYLFDITTGKQIHKLLPNDGSADKYFGWSVSINGTTAIVGAIGDDENGAESGSAYLFDAISGQQIFKLLPNDGATGDRFGSSVGVCDSIAIVGSYRNGDNGSDSGSAYLFDVTTGQQITKLLADDGAAGDIFGQSVSISGNTAIVGAEHNDDSGTESGSAYLFDTSSGKQIAKLLADDGAAGDRFGYSVSISGTIAIVGAWPTTGTSGPAYLFDEVCTGGPVCASSGTLIEGSGETNDFNATCGSDNVYWSSHGETFAYALTDPVTQFELTATAPPGFVGNSISVDIEASKSSNNGNLSLLAFLFNHATGSYESLPVIFPLTTTDTVQTFNLPTGSNPDDFVQPGTGEVSLLLFTIQTSGLPNVRTRLDEVLFHFQ